MIRYLDQIISYSARKRPRKTALIEIDAPDKSITYKKLDEEVDSVAYQLTAKGLLKGERVGILSQNSIGFVIVYFAVVRAGGTCVVLNHTLSKADIIDRAKECSVSALYAGRGMERKAKDISGKLKSVRFIVEYPSRVPEKRRKLQPKTENTVALIIFTTGTTGRSAGVMLSHRNLLSNSGSVAKYLNITPASRVCCVLPFYYIYGLSLLFSHLISGGTVIIENRFMYPNVVLDTIEKYKASSFAGVSSHYAIFLYKSDFKKHRLPSLKYYMQAGDAMPRHITEELLSLFPRKKLYIMYGQTEASPRLTYLDPKLARKKPESVGRPIPGVRIKLVNEKGKECGAGEKGEIAAKGDNVMPGYWNNPEDTKKVIKKGWLYTGDVAFRDKDGDIFIVGRKKDFIKIGANKVDPVEIEHLVMKDENIMEAAAVEIPDALLGSRIKLYVAPLPGRKISPRYVMRICRQAMPSYKIPSEVVILKAMPKNSYGKTDKEKLRLI